MSSRFGSFSGRGKNRLGLVPPWTGAAIGVPEHARASFAQCSRSNAYKQLRRQMPLRRRSWMISRGLRSPRTCPALTRNPRFRGPPAHHEAIRGDDPQRAARNAFQIGSA